MYMYTLGQELHELKFLPTDTYTHTCIHTVYIYMYTYTYGVYVSQLVQISRICDTYDTFCARHKLLTRRLIAQGFLYDKLCAYFKKFAIKTYKFVQ